MSKPSAPSSNWEKLKKKLPVDNPKAHPKDSRKRSGKSIAKGVTGIGSSAAMATLKEAPKKSPAHQEKSAARRAWLNGEQQPKDDAALLPAPNDSALLAELRIMVTGAAVLNESKKAIGNYLAIDCEMVGVGHLGSESALARVSIVNFHGHVVLDTFVQPREKVTDWRTWVSGIRADDVVGAPSFADVQKQVAELVEGRILVGHAVENDLKALLLSHPNPLLRDTQQSKQLRAAANTKRPGLKKLAEIELGIRIQSGAHSSVTDARATMALYRLHKVAWEASLRRVMEAYREKTAREDKSKGKEEFPGGGRKGISSGLSVVVKRYGKKVEDQPRRRGPAPASASVPAATPSAEASGLFDE